MQALLCFVPDGKVGCLKTIAVAVLNCKQNGSITVFYKVVYFTKLPLQRLAEEKL